MTKKLTDTEKFNRKIKRMLSSTKECSMNCSECILNNFGENRLNNHKYYGHLCGASAIRGVAKDYIDNYKET